MLFGLVISNVIVGPKSLKDKDNKVLDIFCSSVAWTLCKKNPEEVVWSIEAYQLSTHIQQSPDQKPQQMEGATICHWNGTSRREGRQTGRRRRGWWLLHYHNLARCPQQHLCGTTDPKKLIGVSKSLCE